MTTEEKTVFNQVCVWRGCIVGKDHSQEFEEWMANEMGSRVKYIEEIETLPDMVNGEPVPETGGRNDLFFYVHTNDIPNFSIKRLQFGVSWIEDAISNMGSSIIYPEHVKDHCKW